MHINASKEGRSIHVAEDPRVRMVGKLLRVNAPSCNMDFGLRPTLQERWKEALVHPETLLGRDDHHPDDGGRIITALGLMFGAQRSHVVHAAETSLKINGEGYAVAALNGKT